MQPYSQTTTFTTAASSLLIVLHHLQPGIKLTKENSMIKYLSISLLTIIVLPIIFILIYNYPVLIVFLPITAGGLGTIIFFLYGTSRGKNLRTEIRNSFSKEVDKWTSKKKS